MVLAITAHFWYLHIHESQKNCQQKPPTVVSRFLEVDLPRSSNLPSLKQPFAEVADAHKEQKILVGPPADEVVRICPEANGSWWCNVGIMEIEPRNQMMFNSFNWNVFFLAKGMKLKPSEDVPAQHLHDLTWISNWWCQICWDIAFQYSFLLNFVAYDFLEILKVHHFSDVTKSSRMAASWALVLSCAWVEHTWVAMENQTLPMHIVRCRTSDTVDGSEIRDQLTSWYDR